MKFIILALVLSGTTAIVNAAGIVTVKLSITIPPGVRSISAGSMGAVEKTAVFQFGVSTNEYQSVQPLGQYSGKAGSAIRFTTLFQDFGLQQFPNDGWHVQCKSATVHDGNTTTTIQGFKLISNAYANVKEDWTVIANIAKTEQSTAFDLGIPTKQNPGNIFSRFVIFLWDPPTLI